MGHCTVVLTWRSLQIVATYQIWKLYGQWCISTGSRFPNTPKRKCRNFDKISSLGALKVVILTTFGAASDNFIKMTVFLFQCMLQGLHSNFNIDCDFKTAHTLQWRHNGLDGVSNHQPYDCLLNRLFRRRSKKTSKLRVIGLCEGNSPVTGEFPAQRASNAENVSIWWRHHVYLVFVTESILQS